MSAARKTTKKKAPAKKPASSKKTTGTSSKKGASSVAEKEDDAQAAPAPKKKRRGRALVIVESPAKARTINKYLGKDYVVKASMGHIRDLPKGKFGIDLEHGFQPDYQTIKGKTKVLAELKKLASTARAIYLAPDLDREGEAIAWHLREGLGLDDRDEVYRVVFNEITKSAILAAFEEPGKLDMHKVEAQQARRVLDRIMGYKLSPLLWKKIAKGLSAGRVQSVAVRLIVEREKEIRAFVKEEYWRVAAHFQVDGKEFQAELKKLGEERIDKNLTEERARALVARIGANELELFELEEKPKTRPPTPPFATSQLQQKSSTMLRFSAKKTMMLAQQLYEGVEIPGEGSVGLITYMRTDSIRVSDDAISQVRTQIEQDFGTEYLPDKPNTYRNKSKNAQEAHEAIRPTVVALTPDRVKASLTTDQHKLYTLIWNKFVASQMKPARSNVTTAVFVDPEGGAGPEPARFVAQGKVLVFDGHTRVFDAGGKDDDEQALPLSLKQGAKFAPSKVDPTQHFTQPPPRYSEATLVKELEKKGIGRPSTYATIISTIQDRGYVLLEQRRFLATELGEIVTDQLVAHFGDILDTEFTAGMESDLDRVESGDREWQSVVKAFHDVFAVDLEKAETGMKNLKKEPKLTERKCEKCGSPMAELYNKRGKFLGCSNYPECKNTMPTDGPRPKAEVIETDKKCDKCDKPMVIRTGSRGRFIACTGFPKCKNTASVDADGNVIKPKETGIACEKCESPMIIKGSRRGPFLACSAFPKCRNAKPLPEHLREEPEKTGVDCEKCGKPMVKKTTRWGKPFLACSGYPECKNAMDAPEEEKPSGDGEDGAATEAAGASTEAKTPESEA